MRSIAKSELFERIVVRPPYFALENIVFDEGILSATVESEQPLGREASPIIAAEVGRHLAILGLCSVALSRSEQKRHYYLAYDAKLTKELVYPELRLGNSFQATAQGKMLDKRTAIASASMLDISGNLTYKLLVHYHVVSEQTFERLYGQHQHSPIIENDFNPYRVALPLHEVKISNHQLQAKLGWIMSAQCAGHFPAFPSMPVAILMSALSSAAGQLLKQLLKDEDIRYVVREAIVQADNLAFAGEFVEVQAEYLESQGNDYIFSTRAIANGIKDVGNLRIVLSVCKSASPLHTQKVTNKNQ